MRANTIEMLENVRSLKWRERKSCIGEDRALGWVQTVHLEVVACDMDESWVGPGK